MPGEYKANFFFPAGVITVEDDGRIDISVSTGKKMTSEELAAAAIISEMLTRLRSGKFVRYDFNAQSFEDETRLVKCEWLRSGNLKIHGPADKQYDHAENKEQALSKHRTFTCSVALSKLIPKKREIRVVAVNEGEVSSGNS